MADVLNGFSFVDVVEDAVARSGGQAAVASDVLSARRSLFLLLQEWENQGFNTWRIKQTNVGGGGASGFQLSRRVDDVFSMNVYTQQNDSTSTISPMSRIGADQYSMLTDKATKGTPSQYYLNRTEPPRMFVYPAGREGGELFDLWYVERPMDFDRNSNDMDAPGRWIAAIVHGVAYDLAMKRPRVSEQKLNRLETRARISLIDAQGADRQRTGYRPRARFGNRRRAGGG